jgi:hypothetical protein
VCLLHVSGQKYIMNRIALYIYNNMEILVKDISASSVISTMFSLLAASIAIDWLCMIHIILSITSSVPYHEPLFRRYIRVQPENTMILYTCTLYYYLQMCVPLLEKTHCVYSLNMLLINKHGKHNDGFNLSRSSRKMKAYQTITSHLQTF